MNSTCPDSHRTPSAALTRTAAAGMSSALVSALACCVAGEVALASALAWGWGSKVGSCHHHRNRMGRRASRTRPGCICPC